MCLLILLCPHQMTSSDFFHVEPQIHTLLPLPKIAVSPLILMLLFIFPSLPVHFFSQIDCLSMFVSLNITTTFKFFLFLLLKGFSLAKSFNFLKVLKKHKDVHFDWTI